MPPEHSMRVHESSSSFEKHAYACVHARRAEHSEFVIPPNKRAYMYTDDTRLLTVCACCHWPNKIYCEVPNSDSEAALCTKICNEHTCGLDMAAYLSGDRQRSLGLIARVRETQGYLQQASSKLRKPLKQTCCNGACKFLTSLISIWAGAFAFGHVRCQRVCCRGSMSSSWLARLHSHDVPGVIEPSASS